MIKGEKPYDQAVVDTSLTQLEETAKKLPAMFPDSIKGLKIEGDYRSSPKIWEDKAGFAAKIDSFAKVVTEAKAQDQGSRLAEGRRARHRQGMQRLPRDVPSEERLIVRSKAQRADARSVRPLFCDRQPKNCSKARHVQKFVQAGDEKVGHTGQVRRRTTDWRMLRRIFLGLILVGVVGFGIYWWLTTPVVVAASSAAAAHAEPCQWSRRVQCRRLFVLPRRSEPARPAETRRRAGDAVAVRDVLRPEHLA